MTAKPKQQTFFTQGDDLPLFSGTAPAARIAAFAPRPAASQASFGACRLCQDTGVVRSRFCTCPAGDAARSRALARPLPLDALKAEGATHVSRIDGEPWTAFAWRPSYLGSPYQRKWIIRTPDGWDTSDPWRPSWSLDGARAICEIERS